MHPPTDVNLLDISLNEGATLAVPLAEGLNAFILPVAGRLEVDGQTLDAVQAQVPMFEAQDSARSITLSATHGPVQVVVFSGQPLEQPVHWQGPMALASARALNDRIAAYQRGEFGTV